MFMKKRLTYLLLCLITSIGFVMAQTTRITGTVISAEDNEPVIGASLVVKGTTTGTVTDFDGTFTLNVPAGARTLQVSYIGMEPQEVAITPVMNIVMRADTKTLDEVVVTAMGLTREKKSLGYAVQELKAEELTQAGQLSLTGSLTGKVAGVQVNQFGGSVGSSSRISVRGNSSLAADQQPLIVVDGVPIANDTQRSGNNIYVGVDYGSGLNDINPEDIESITVLKGGSAALYGMRAGNGVILVTTKSGKGKRGVTISYDGQLSIDNISTLPKLQNEYGQGYSGDEYHFNQSDYTDYQKYAVENSFSWLNGYGGVYDSMDESWGPRLDAGLMIPQYDSNGAAVPWISRKNNIKDFFRTGYSMNHTVSVLSQAEKSSTRVSLSFRDQAGTVPNTDQKRYSGQVNTDMELNKYVKFDLSANYTRTESDNLPAQGYGGSNPINGLFLWSARQINMQSLKDNWDQKDAAGNYTLYNWNTSYHLNPYFNVYENTNGYQRDRFFAKSSLYYQPFEFLKFEGRFGMDYYNAQTFERHYIDYSDYTEGGFEQRIQKNTELNLDFIASFNKTFGDFNVSAMAGANYRNLNWEENLTGAKALTVLGYYTIGNKKGDANVLMDHSTVRSNSVYASGSVGWKSQLYLDASVRNDWSSTIRDPFFYPSVSLAWIPTESFEALKNNYYLSFLKLRGGWAEIGSATSPYRNRAYYFARNDADNGAFNGVAQMYKSTTYPNEGLRPESVKTWEVGIDVGLFDNRLRADVAYYDKSTTDQILSVTTAQSSGYGSRLINAGEITNKGIEIQLRGDILRSKSGLNWTSTLNYAKDKSEIVELYPELKITTYQVGWTWGIANLAKKGQTWGTLSGVAYDRTDDGAIKVNQRGLIQTVSGEDIGHVSPDFLAGWRNDFSIKDWSFGFFMDLRIGGDIWSQSMSHGYAAGTAQYTVDNGIRERAIVAGKDVMTDERFVMNAGTAENPNWVENTIATDAQTWFRDGGVAEMYVFDGSYLKLREAYVTYVIPSSVLAKSRYISKATVSLIGSNLALLWTHKSNTLRLDPETGGVSSDSRGVGYEQASVPTSRSFGIKLGITF
jgi:TonB-linked SusC/RagA family outer membrane protein